MQILPIRTKRLDSGSNLTTDIRASGVLQSGDIIVVSSKVVAVTEDAGVHLGHLEPRKESLELAKASELDSHFVELVLRETERMDGSVQGTCPHAILTSLRPKGMKRGRILCPNAGVDQSNAEEGHAIPWPKDPVTSARKLHAALGAPVVISDSCCHPGRLGVTAFALTVSGFDPVVSSVGQADLFGKTLRITQEALADQLATAANTVMGNGAESVPAVVIRDHGVSPSSFCGWVDGIETEEDLFRGMI